MKDEFGNKITENIAALPIRHDSGWEFMESIEGSIQGGTALVVLGGNSAAGWEALRDAIKPDVLIGANGAIIMIDTLDYYVHTENINGIYKRATKYNDETGKKIINWTRIDTPKHRLVHHISAPCYRNKNRLVRINRWGFELSDIPPLFNIRRYGFGLISGDLMNRPEIIASLRCGTVGLQCLHLAGLLGCARVVTIGYDLCFKGDTHHWYKDDFKYKANTYWGDNMFTVQNGLPTLWFWVDTAAYLRRFNEQVLKLAGIKWQDKSDGLLQSMKVLE